MGDIHVFVVHVTNYNQMDWLVRRFTVRMSTTLSVYVGRHFLMAVLLLLVLILLLVFMIDIIELLRRAAAKPNITINTVINMALLKLQLIV